MLKDYASSPLGYWLRHVRKVAPAKTSPALRYGELLHLRHELLSDEWKRRVRIAPESVLTATGQLGKDGKKWMQELHPEEIGLAPDEAERLDEQWLGIERNPAAMRLIEARVDAEFVCRWDWDGHPMRCRGDGATAERWYDLKTTSDKDVLADFGHSVIQWGYDLQAAVYREASLAAGWDDEPMAFIATSTVWPHHTHVVELPREVVMAARCRAVRYLKEIKQRTEFDHWLPDDYGEIVELKVPRYWRDK
jgi:hypothetical protein